MGGAAADPREETGGNRVGWGGTGRDGPRKVQSTASRVGPQAQLPHTTRTP